MKLLLILEVWSNYVIIYSFNQRSRSTAENPQSIYYLRTLKHLFTEFRCSKWTFVLIYKNEKHLYDLLSSIWAEIDEQDQQEDKAQDEDLNNTYYEDSPAHGYF